MTNPGHVDDDTIRGNIAAGQSPDQIKRVRALEFKGV
jgi:hypothetical protein